MHVNSCLLVYYFYDAIKHNFELAYTPCSYTGICLYHYYYTYKSYLILFTFIDQCVNNNMSYNRHGYALRHFIDIEEECYCNIIHFAYIQYTYVYVKNKCTV